MSRIKSDGVSVGVGEGVVVIWLNGKVTDGRVDYQSPPERRLIIFWRVKKLSAAHETYFEMEERVLAAISGPLDDRAFNTLALEIYQFQRAQNPHYKNFCGYLKTPVDLDDWRQIPAVPQTAFKQFALRSFPEKSTTTTFRTSGTTGEGFGSHHFCSLKLYDASILAAWDFFRLPRLPQMILTPSPTEAPHSSLSHMMGVLRQRTAEQRFVVENGDLKIEKITQELRKFGDLGQPVLILGTALAFLHFVEQNEGRCTLPPGSWVFETGGYKGLGRNLTRKHLHDLIKETFGVNSSAIINEYGMTELSSQFYAIGSDAPHRNPPWCRALIIDPETDEEVGINEQGVIRIVDLANLGSVLALQTRDLAIRGVDGFKLVGRDPAALPRGCSRAADEMLA